MRVAKFDLPTIRTKMDVVAFGSSIYKTDAGPHLIFPSCFLNGGYSLKIWR